MFQCIKVTILASLNGYAPAIAVEFGRKVLFSTERPSFIGAGRARAPREGEVTAK